MGHIPEDDNFDEYMDASAEKWSEPQKPAANPSVPDEPTNRWGSPISDISPDSGTDKKRSKQSNDFGSEYTSAEKKSGKKWWIIAIVVVLVLCLCLCVVLFGLPILGINLLGLNMFQGNPITF